MCTADSSVIACIPCLFWQYNLNGPLTFRYVMQLLGFQRESLKTKRWPGSGHLTSSGNIWDEEWGCPGNWVSALPLHPILHQTLSVAVIVQDVQDMVTLHDLRRFVKLAQTMHAF